MTLQSIKVKKKKKKCYKTHALKKRKREVFWGEGGEKVKPIQEVSRE